MEWNLPVEMEFIDDLQHIFDFEKGTVKVDTESLNLTVQSGLVPLFTRPVSQPGVAGYVISMLRFHIYHFWNLDKTLNFVFFVQSYKTSTFRDISIFDHNQVCFQQYETGW